LSYGIRIADVERPKFDKVKERETTLGRVDPYVEPTGGEMHVYKENLFAALSSKEIEETGEN
jgi:hypothetical protein